MKTLFIACNELYRFSCFSFCIFDVFLPECIWMTSTMCIFIKMILHFLSSFGCLKLGRPMPSGIESFFFLFNLNKLETEELNRNRIKWSFRFCLWLSVDSSNRTYLTSFHCWFHFVGSRKSIEWLCKNNFNILIICDDKSYDIFSTNFNSELQLNKSTHVRCIEFKSKIKSFRVRCHKYFV